MSTNPKQGNVICADMLRRLGWGKFCPVITVAGTNGKGTSCHLLAAYWQQRGKKVGLFTSPHLLHFNERICIDQVPVSDEDVQAAFERIKSVRQDLDLGYFQQAFLAAMLIFQTEKVDLLIVEVGIGGRLDAVNSIDADAALITSIALDHTEILGADRERIGFEKAGILRRGQIAVCGDFDAPQSILDHALHLGVDLIVAGQNFTWAEAADYPECFIPRQNMLAVRALLQRMDPGFDAHRFAQVVAHLRVPGRMQIIAEQPQILIDVAHNPHAANYLAQYLAAHPVAGRTYAVFSALQEKDIAGMCSVMRAQVDHWFLLELQHDRAASFATLHQALPFGSYSEFAGMQKLYLQLLEQAKPEDRIVVFGSFVLVGLFLECHNQSYSH